ncbi:MAG TPA: endolytic transglycosylase MltG [Acidimicrobiales bacterium]|nr:endolytic transglycosylase MltG [Acidimicrobiales bacterium]
MTTLTTDIPPAPSPSPPRRPRWLVVSGLVVAAVLLIAAVGAAFAEHQIRGGGAGGPEVELSIPSGSSSHQIADLLGQHGVISDPLLFLIYMRVHGGGPFEAGVYLLHRHSSYGSVIRTLAGGPPTTRLVIPEGFTLGQIAARVGALPGHSAAHFLAVAGSGEVRSRFQPAGSSNLEGLLFPATYPVTMGESDAQILSTMVQRFDQAADQVGLGSASATVGVDPYQAVIVASMIEREAKLAEDRGLVAQVVYNRLRKGMKLQVDATVLYALGPGRTSLTSADLKVVSPYNTYLVTGLPPTPIACPGVAALQAGLHPPPGNFLYYVVVQANGKEAFSATLAGQEQNIALARSRGLR